MARVPNFIEYHKSLTAELHSLKDRIRDLVTHWPTDGEHKEVALRSILRRHVPESVIVGRGFIVTPSDSSTQIDVLLVDANVPTLFKDGDLMIVTPDAVRAVIEVKTSLIGPAAINQGIEKLATIAALCDGDAPTGIWTGMFVYDAPRDADENLLRAASQAHRETGVAVNCVSYGKATLLRHWTRDEMNRGVPEPRAGWRSYNLEDLAPSYFLGNLLGWLASGERGISSYAWFPFVDGKEQYARYWIEEGHAELVPCHVNGGR